MLSLLKINLSVDPLVTGISVFNPIRRLNSSTDQYDRRKRPNYRAAIFDFGQRKNGI